MCVLDDLQDKYPVGIRVGDGMSMEFQIASLRIQVRERLSEKESGKIWLATLCELEEHLIASVLKLELEQ